MLPLLQQHQNTAIQMLCMLSHVIINHAADERISLEELHEKVLSGQKRTTTYLDFEHEAVHLWSSNLK